MAETFLPTSTNIAKVDYDAAAQAMTITFKDGRAWLYSGVSADVFRSFQHAPSAGSFFHRNIKSRYPETEV